MKIYYETSDELKHYGVIGMKWGIRRGRASQAYEKASRKLDRLQNKADKKQRKADKYLSKLQRAKYGWSLADPEKLEAKVGRAQYKADKAKKKTLKWINKMDKTFANTKISLSKKQIDARKRMEQELRKRYDASSSKW